MLQMELTCLTLHQPIPHLHHENNTVSVDTTEVSTWRTSTWIRLLISFGFSPSLFPPQGGENHHQLWCLQWKNWKWFLGTKRSLKDSKSWAEQNHEWDIPSFFPLSSLFFSFLWFFFFFSSFLWPHLWHLEVPRLWVELELQLPAYTTATPDLSCICDRSCGL